MWLVYIWYIKCRRGRTSVYRQQSGILAPQMHSWRHAHCDAPTRSRQHAITSGAAHPSCMHALPIPPLPQPRTEGPTSEFPMSSSVGKPTAVPWALSRRQRRGPAAFRASRVGVCAWWTALNSSRYLPHAMQEAGGGCRGCGPRCWRGMAPGTGGGSMRRWRGGGPPRALLDTGYRHSPRKPQLPPTHLLSPSPSSTMMSRGLPERGMEGCGARRNSCGCASRSRRNASCPCSCRPCPNCSSVRVALWPSVIASKGREATG